MLDKVVKFYVHDSFFIIISKSVYFYGFRNITNTLSILDALFVGIDLCIVNQLFSGYATYVAKLLIVVFKG